jgi:hypothetical protein
MTIFQSLIKFLTPVLRIVFLLYFIVVWPLQAEEIDEPDLPEGFALQSFYDEDFSDIYKIPTPEMAYAQSINAEQKPEANQALTTLEGGPSATVAGCVNAISDSSLNHK